jgi:hypothetical protein
VVELVGAGVVEVLALQVDAAAVQVGQRLAKYTGVGLPWKCLRMLRSSEMNSWDLLME